jgi:hypothetical protein
LPRPQKLDHSPTAEEVPLIQVGTAYNVLAVNPSVPVNSLLVLTADNGVSHKQSNVLNQLEGRRSSGAHTSKLAPHTLLPPTPACLMSQISSFHMRDCKLR